MKTGTFWSPFIFFSCLAVLCIVSVGGFIFIQYVHSDNPASVIQGHDFARDPFNRPLIPYSEITNNSKSRTPLLKDGFLYKDNIIEGLGGWGWHASGDWKSSQQVAEGSYSLKVQYAESLGTFGASGFMATLGSTTKSLTAMVNPDTNVGDVRVSLFDEDGNVLKEQSLGWYSLNKKLIPSVWQRVDIPIANLVSTTTRAITGFGMSGLHAGTVFFDSIRFSAQGVDAPPWVSSPEDMYVAYDPLATSTQFTLPYRMHMEEGGMVGWHTFFGKLAISDGVLSVGPARGSNTDSLSVFRNGKLWKNYYTEARLDWGETSVFALISRFVDDRNYLSCAFSHYGDTVQIYQVKDGVSSILAQSPGLSTPYDEAWKGVTVASVVSGNKITCIVNDEKVLTYNVAGAPAYGTVGIEAYDENPFASAHHVHAFSVRNIDSK